MVDWDRVEELRSKGVGWDKIAADAKVGFHADSSAGDPGRALRALYHRRGGAARARKPSGDRGAAPGTERKGEPSRWTLLRLFYLLVPLVGIWFALAYFIPSPVGLLVPAFPWLGLLLAAVAVVLIWQLWRSTSGPRWNAVYRNGVVYGVVLGFVFSGVVALTASVAFGCPFLPAGSSLGPVSNSGWTAGSQAIAPWYKVPTNAWQDGGKPVVYFYGATWCPYCSASSWAVWKALKAFGMTSGGTLDYSATSDVYPGTPEIVLSGITMGARGSYAPVAAFQVSEDTSGVESTYPGTASCTQQAYVTAYATGIPFVVVNGQYEHDASLVLPQNLSSYASGNNGGAAAVAASVLNETGAPWASIQFSAYWFMAFLVKVSGQQLTTLANDFGWTSADKAAVANDLALM